jgi:hypothetical protein
VRKRALVDDLDDTVVIILKPDRAVMFAINLHGVLSRISTALLFIPSKTSVLQWCHALFRRESVAG